MEECKWTHDQQDDKWGGECGAAWWLCEGTPSENNMNYCPKCGKKLEEVTSDN